MSELENIVQVSEDMKVCNQCGAKVKADAQFCSSCGKPVIAKPTKIFCQTCGTELEDSEMFCPKCGSSSSANKNAEALNNIAVYNESIAIQQPKKTKKKKFLNILLVSLAVAIALALLTFFVIIPEVTYRMACAELNKGNYDAAYSAFVDLGDYRDSKDMLDECEYQKACDKLDKNLYSTAIDMFEDLGSYKDSATKILECKYCYVEDNLNNYDRTTFQYLKELKSKYYKDSADIYEDLYDWKVTVVAVNSSEDDTTTNKESISKYRAVYFHIELEGGEPGESIRLQAKATLPNGRTDEYTFNNEWYDGGSGWYGYYEGIYAYPEYGDTGNMQCRFYNYSTGELLGIGSVKITN